MNAGSEEPLPYGWDQKYDEKYHTFYYIDHIRQRTTWIDPRKSNDVNSGCVGIHFCYHILFVSLAFDA